MASFAFCLAVPSTPVFWGAPAIGVFVGRQGTMELSPRLSVVCSGSLRPSGMTSVVNSMGAMCNGVKSPPRMAIVRCALEIGCSRLTVPSTTAPAGITWRSNAYTGSPEDLGLDWRTARFGTRFVRYKRSGTPAGTTRGISCCWLTSLAGGAAERMESDERHKIRISPLKRMFEVGRRWTVWRVRLCASGVRFLGVVAKTPPLFGRSGSSTIEKESWGGGPTRDPSYLWARIRQGFGSSG